MISRPQTLKQARAYRYGAWAGCPDGNPYREGFCVVEVFSNERGHMHHQCGNRGVPYCGVHRPGAKEERAANRPPTKFEREMAELDTLTQMHRDLRRLRRALKAITAMRCACRVNEIAAKALAPRRKAAKP